NDGAVQLMDNKGVADVLEYRTVPVLALAQGLFRQLLVCDITGHPLDRIGLAVTEDEGAVRFNGNPRRVFPGDGELTHPVLSSVLQDLITDLCCKVILILRDERHEITLREFLQGVPEGIESRLVCIEVIPIKVMYVDKEKG